jgi:hypothetical protein
MQYTLPCTFVVCVSGESIFTPPFPVLKQHFNVYEESQDSLVSIVTVLRAGRTWFDSW